MTSSALSVESLAAQVREGGVSGHRAFDELASVANGQPAARPLFIELEDEIKSGSLTLEPYPEVVSQTLLQRLLSLLPAPSTNGILPPDRW